MSDSPKSAVVEEELKEIQAPKKTPCAFKDCSCFIRQEEKFCSEECEKNFAEHQSEGIHSGCSCDHADCVRIPGMDAASVFAQRSLN